MTFEEEDRGCPRHCSMFSCIPGLDSLADSNTPSPTPSPRPCNQKCLYTAPVFPRGKAFVGRNHWCRPAESFQGADRPREWLCFPWCWDSSEGNPAPCLHWGERTAQAAVRAVGGNTHGAVKSRQMSWTQMKTEMWAQALSVFARRNHFTAMVRMELVFNDLRLPSSTTRALKNLYIVGSRGAVSSN